MLVDPAAIELTQAVVSTPPSGRAEKRADQGPREEGSGGVRGCTLRSPDDRERRDATLIGTALESNFNDRFLSQLVHPGFQPILIFLPLEDRSHLLERLTQRLTGEHFF